MVATIKYISPNPLPDMVATVAAGRAFCGVVYAGTLPCGLSYIGKDANYPSRILEHRRAKGGCPEFHNAIRHYGAASIQWRIIGVAFSKDALQKAERFAIKYYDTISPNGYNIYIPSQSPVGRSRAAILSDKEELDDLRREWRNTTDTNLFILFHWNSTGLFSLLRRIADELTDNELRQLCHFRQNPPLSRHIRPSPMDSRFCGNDEGGGGSGNDDIKAL